MTYRIAGIVLALGISVSPAASNAEPVAITCGVQLGPGGAYVLHQDLTCPPNPRDSYEHVIGLVEATLDLNGHTLDCAGRMFGVRLFGASVIRNGTVRGCSEGVLVSGEKNVVRGVTVTGNRYGLFIQGAHDNIVTASTASGNSLIGFYVDDGSRRNALIGNTASGNGQGFLERSARDTTYIGNVASNNAGGGFDTEGHGRLQGNQAIKNGAGGFRVEVSNVELIGNTANKNKEYGFQLGDYGRGNAIVRDNVAKGNDGDGFQVRAAFPSPGSASDVVLRQNYAISNRDNGIRVTGQPGGFTHAIIAGNTSIGHVAPSFDLADDYPGCVEGTVWEDNVFETASQPCVQ